MSFAIGVVVGAVGAFVIQKYGLPQIIAWVKTKLGYETPTPPPAS